MGFEEIENRGVAKFLEELSAELSEKTYAPLPSRPVEIPKSNGKMRTLKIPEYRAFKA